MRLVLCAFGIAAVLLGDKARGAEVGMSDAVEREMLLIAKAHSDLSAYDLQIDAHLQGANRTHLISAVLQCDRRERCLRKIGPLETLETPRWSIAVNSNAHTITVYPRDTQDAAPAILGDPDQAIRAWLASDPKVSGGELTSSGRRWVFQPVRTEQVPLEIFVDPSSRRLGRVEYAISDGETVSQVQVDYTWRNPALLEPAAFDEDRIIVERGAEVAPAEAYAEYRIIRADRP